MSGKTKLTKGRPDRCCFSCRHWSGEGKSWHEIGESRGTCVWLANLIVTHASIGIPQWVSDQPPVRVTYDDDGADCDAWAGRAALSDLERLP